MTYEKKSEGIIQHSEFDEGMSICDDCPARIKEVAKPPKIGMEITGCWLGVWNSFPYRDQLDKPPDTCPDAIALKVKRENPDMVLVAVPDCADYVDAVCIEHYEGIGNNHESAGRYWIKPEKTGSTDEYLQRGVEE